MQRAFELYILRQQDWEIESVFEDRDTALASARRLREASPRLTLRIVDETFDPDSGQTSSHIIFQAAGSGHEASEGARRPRNRRLDAGKRPAAKPPAKPRQRLSAPITLRLLGVAAVGLLLLIALSYLPQVVH